MFGSNWKMYRDADLEEKVMKSHERVLNSFLRARIRLDPVPLIIAPQEMLLELAVIERQKADVFFNPGAYIEGLYTNIFRAIALDVDICKGYGGELDYVMAHEYAHHIFGRFFMAAQRGHFEDERANHKRPSLPKFEGEFDPIEELIKHIESMKGDKKTEDEKRRFELDRYFEESYAVGVGLYLTNQVEDGRWVARSSVYHGKVLGRDQVFMDSLQRTMHRAVFDRMFTHGLRNVTVGLPTVYQIVRNAFEMAYQRRLEQKPILM